MSELMIIVRRELLERVRAKSFLIGTVVFPIFMGALIVMGWHFVSVRVAASIALPERSPTSAPISTAVC